MLVSPKSKSVIGQKYIHSILETVPIQLSKLQNSRKYRTSFFINTLIRTLNDLYTNVTYYYKNFNGEFLTLDLTAFRPNQNHPFLIMEYENGNYFNVIEDEFQKLISVQSNYKILIYNYKNLTHFSSKFDYDLKFRNEISKFHQTLSENSKSDLNINKEQTSNYIFDIIVLQYYNNCLLLRYSKFNSNNQYLTTKPKTRCYMIP